ncbi:Clp protease N-terminal domain-containing protein [Streptomyces sp. NPDC048172]|uniref:Clp protease N-terminal domain-containing protein n=1 Tax=Streptomyces sp. NPDC048172 TaxID=3365505 RepID=UPI00371E8619
MTATTSPDWNTVGILGAARGARPDAEGPIGSEHLLAGITTAKGAAREALAAEGATKVALLAVLRDRAERDGAWSVDDDAEGAVTGKDILGEDGEERIRYTGEAARALTAARERAGRAGAKKFGAEQLLRGLLDGENRAVEVLGACGVSPQAVLDRLDGGAGSAASDGGQGEDLGPLLHATRDVLLGHRHYRRAPWWMRWLLKRSGINWAARPAWWVRMETYEQARRLGSDTVGTEHVLLAVLATHEVALRYPHLAGEGDPAPGSRYAGGERLARLGLDHASVHGALVAGDRVRLTSDARPVEQYIDATADADGRETAPDPGTGPLVEALLGEETRARLLVDALTARPDS